MKPLKESKSYAETGLIGNCPKRKKFIITNILEIIARIAKKCGRGLSLLLTQKSRLKFYKSVESQRKNDV